MGQVVLVNCALAAQRAGDCGGPWACAHGIQDVAPPGLSSHSSLVKVLCCTVQWLQHKRLDISLRQVIGSEPR